MCVYVVYVHIKDNVQCQDAWGLNNVDLSFRAAIPF